jgi:hypothetical protein
LAFSLQTSILFPLLTSSSALIRDQLLTVFFGGYKLQAETLKHLAQAAGAFGFITSLLGFYLLLSILLAEVQGPSESWRLQSDASLADSFAFTTPSQPFLLETCPATGLSAAKPRKRRTNSKKSIMFARFAKFGKT